MAPFAGLDYHIAVTTTSPIGNNTIWKPSLDYVDGKFVELEDGVHCIKKSTHSLQQAQTLIQNNVVRDLYLRDDSGNTVINPITLPHPERPILVRLSSFGPLSVLGASMASAPKTRICPASLRSKKAPASTLEVHSYRHPIRRLP